MHHDFIINNMSPDVKTLYIFCDSYAVQNKNSTLFQYVYYSVKFIKRLSTVMDTLPDRRHTYMECDHNMTLITKKQVAEFPKDWYNITRKSTVKPTPFNVTEYEQKMFKDWTKFFKERNEYTLRRNFLC